MTLPFTRLISVAFLTAWAGYAAACEVEHALAFEMKSGSHNVRLNGLLVHHGIFKSGTIPLEKGLIEGENTISVFYMDLFGNGAARYALLQRCKGQNDNVSILGELAFDSESNQELRFTVTAVAPAIYPGAEITDGAGLKAAIQELQNAVQARDVRAVLAFHAPYLARLKAEGTSVRRTKSRLRQVLSQGEVAIVPNFEMQPVMGGQAWEVRAAFGVPPVSASLKTSSGYEDWSSGTLWVFVDGRWSVLEP